jgi:hypothetical protein
LVQHIENVVSFINHFGCHSISQSGLEIRFGHRLRSPATNKEPKRAGDQCICQNNNSRAQEKTRLINAMVAGLSRDNEVLKHQ